MTKQKEKIIEGLLEHDLFHLTGSRYWNRHSEQLVPLTPETDWDFVAEYNLEVIKKLLANGFEARSDSTGIGAASYGDGSTVCVLYYDKDVQIIFKKNVSIYLEVQNTIGVEFYANYLWKKNGNSITDIQTILNSLYEITIKKIELNKLELDLGDLFE